MENMKLLVKVLYMCTCATLYVHGQGTKTIVTPSGSVQGLMVPIPYYKSDVYQFRAVPYAKPPIGPLRFAMPVPIGSWSGTLNATQFGPSCMQNISIMNTSALPNKRISEDCLLLNIYMPPNSTAESKKPVMFFIHGGSYVFGQGMLYDASYMSIFGDVIVVTINYRLNVFGFLSTGDAACPGNLGLYDQQLAMKWVKDNIRPFGGDPEMMTIFGESAGGFSVSLHSLSPLNKGLFKRAIAQSGSSNSYFAVTTDGKLAMAGVALFTKCDHLDSKRFIECLRSKDAVDLLDALGKAVEFVFDHLNLHYLLMIAPVVDGVLVADDPNRILADPTSPGNEFFKTIDFIGGDVSSEGSLLLTDPLPDFQQRYKFNISDGIPHSVLEHVVTAINEDFAHLDTTKRDKVVEFYTSPNGDGANQSMSSVNMFSDFFFLTPATTTLNTHVSKNSNTKTFQFFLPRQNRWGIGYPFPSWFEGAGHASELIYLFGIAGVDGHTAEDEILAQQMMTYWTNFARNGDPNVGRLPRVIWPLYTADSRPCISLDLLNVTQCENRYRQRTDFWLDILRK